MSRRAVVFASAYLLDWAAGDPEWFPHPVRLIGKGIKHGERILRRHSQTADVELAAGAVLTFGVVATAYLSTATIITWMNERDTRLGFVAEMLLGWTCLASRNLHDEASAVVTALEKGDVLRARQRLARIVGRDTQDLDGKEISRAVIETVAESCSDGIVAPLFYMALGGVPLAMAYKAVNTLDSMIGHADDRYFYFGKVAARLDDAVNLLPARLTAMGVVVASSVVRDASPAAAFAIWLRDGLKHKSPNAGQPESAMAGALQVQLGGENFYAGESMTAPLIGEPLSQPSARQARKAIRIVGVVSVMAALCVLALGRRQR